MPSQTQLADKFCQTTSACILEDIVEICIILKSEELPDDVWMHQLFEEVSLPEDAFNFLIL